MKKFFNSLILWISYNLMLNGSLFAGYYFGGQCKTIVGKIVFVYYIISDIILFLSALGIWDDNFRIKYFSYDDRRLQPLPGTLLTIVFDFAIVYALFKMEYKNIAFCEILNIVCTTYLEAVRQINLSYDERKKNELK